MEKGWQRQVSVDRRRRQPDEGSSQTWLATYGDLVTLLLVFFVMLFAMSKVDQDRFRMVISAFHGSMGVLDSGRTITEDDGAISGARSDRAEMVERNPHDLLLTQNIVQSLSQLREDEGLQSTFSVDVAERGIVLHFTEAVFFDLGRADLKPESEQLLHRIFDILLEWPYQIRVEGHTDNWPIDTVRFPSNWELSTARAARVVRFIIDEKQIDPDRLSAAGYGEYRPIASNTTAEGRSKNRRVDIVLLNGAHSDWEPTTMYEK